jgi:hypothetical protein
MTVEFGWLATSDTPAAALTPALTSAGAALLAFTVAPEIVTVPPHATINVAVAVKRARSFIILI